jgi:hypothetical protein
MRFLIAYPLVPLVSGTSSIGQSRSRSRAQFQWPEPGARRYQSVNEKRVQAPEER